MRKRPFALQSVCFAVVLVAACGGDDSSVTTSDAGGGGPDATTGGGDAGQTGGDGGQNGGDAGKESDTGGGGTDGALPFDAGASVVQHHNAANRDGVYVDGALTKAAVAGLKPDTAFKPQFQGPLYAQPLFVDGAVGGKDALIVATEQNVVYAFDATTGAQLWKTPALGAPVPLSKLPCGNIDPLGITGTPYLDLPSRTIYLGAMTTPDGGTTKKHKIFALSLDDGSVKSGWPVDVEASVPGFASDVQNQRGAVLVQDGILYVPYGGHYGDCGDYHGWLVGVDVKTPATVKAWSTPASGGGSWCAGGVSGDGTSLYITTGNTAKGTTTWGGGDAVIRLAKGPVFSSTATDYFAPANWIDLDNNDTDLGTHALVNAPGVTPSSLVLGFGKDGKIYVTDHANMGGIGHELTSFQASNNGEITAAVTTYTTPAGTFVAFRIDGGNGASCPDGNGGNMAAVKISAGATPKVAEVWCAKEGDMSIPITSMTDAAGSNAIVWNMGGHIYAYDAETGAELFDGGSTTTSGTRYFNTPLIAKGRVFAPADSTIYAFKP